MASLLQAAALYASSSQSTLRKNFCAAINNPNPNPNPNCRPSTFSAPPYPKTLPRSLNLTPLKGTGGHYSGSVDGVSSPLSLKSRLKNGEKLYGIFLLTFSPTIAEIAGLAGYDFAVVDMEHGHGGISDALPCLHALAATNTAAIIRLPDSSAAWAKKALDLGPQGIMFPMIDDAKSARKAVSYCRFPPNGVRGSAHTLIRASEYGIDVGYLSTYEEELLIMCQVESEEGVKKIDEIAAVDGVDCIQMGPLDLSASMGYLWDPGHKKVRAAMLKSEKSVLGGGEAYLSGFVMPHDGAAELHRRGYHMVAGTADVGLFRRAAVEDVSQFKTSLLEEESDDFNGQVPDEKYWSE